jgi:hypothetical protein
MEFSLARTPLDLLLQLRLTLFICLIFNFISLLNRSCINLMFPCTKRSLTQSKEASFSCTFLSCPASLAQFLPSWLTPYSIYYRTLTQIFTRDCARFLTRIATRNFTRVGTRVVPKCFARSFTRVLPGHVPDRVNPALLVCLSGQVKSYPIVYPALPDFLTRPGNLLLALPEALPTPAL